MKPINPNIKSLISIINRQSFIDWFFNLNGVGNILYQYTQQGFSIPQLAVYHANGSFISIIQQVLNGSPSDNQTALNLLVEFIGMIYDIFSYAIPYSQTTIAQQQVNLENQKYNANVPQELMVGICGYMNIYLPNIMCWFYNVNRMMYATNQLINNKGTRTVSKTQGINNVSQNQNISKTSFNPVDVNSTITTNKITVNTQKEGGLQTEQFTANDSANWSTDTNGSSSSINRDETITETDLTQLRELGSEKAIQYLIPLFRKIGTLFWQLGNDNWSENYEVLGFKIW